MVHDEAAVGLDGVRVVFDDQRVVSDAGVGEVLGRVLGPDASGPAVLTAARWGLGAIPASLELGGKDPMIVLADADADIDRAANHAAYYSMFNCGQTCISIERCYVEAPVYDEFVTRVVEHVKAIRQGRPAGPGSVDVGSLTLPS